MKHQMKSTLKRTFIPLLLAGSLLAWAVSIPAVVSALTPEEQERATRAEGEITPEQQAQLKEIEAANQPGAAKGLTPADLTAKALGCGGWGALAPSCALYWILNAIADWVVGKVVSIAGLLFDLAIKFAHLDLREVRFVTIGFGISLGIANMFFVLILLWIAIATIFDFEQFTAKQLLGKLIIAALFINFSLAIGSAFVNLSNGISDVFYKRLTDNGKATIYEGIGTLSKIGAITSGQTLIAEAGQTPKPGQLVRPANTDDLLAVAIQVKIWQLLVSPFLIFVLLAGTFFIIVRQVSLMFLLAFGPFAFLAMVLPYTHKFYSDWWEKLVKWSFFLPAFMLFLYVSLAAGTQLASSVGGNSTDPIPVFFQYFLAIALLIGSLIAAQQSAISGAATVNGWGKKMAGATGKWAGNRGWKYGGKLAEAVTKNPMAAWAMRHPVLTLGTGAAMRRAAAATMKKGTDVEKKDTDFYTRLNDRQLAATLSAANPRLRQRILGSLPEKRLRSARPELRALLQEAGLLPAAAPTAPVTPPTPTAEAQRRQNEAIQNQVTPIVRAMQNMPQEMQAAIENAIQGLPANTSSPAATQAIIESAQNFAQGQTGGAAVVAGAAAANVRQRSTEIRAAVDAAIQRSAPAPTDQLAGQLQNLNQAIQTLGQRIDQMESGGS